MNNSNSQGLLDSRDQEPPLKIDKNNKSNWQVLFLLCGIGFLVSMCNVWVSNNYTTLVSLLKLQSALTNDPLNFDNQENLQKALRIIAPIVAGYLISVTNRRQTLLIACFVLIFSEILINLGFQYNTATPPFQKNGILGTGCMLFTFGYDMILVSLIVIIGRWFEKSYASVAYGVALCFVAFGGMIAGDYSRIVLVKDAVNFLNIGMLEQFQLSMILCIILFVAAIMASKIDKTVELMSVAEPKFQLKDIWKFRWFDFLLIMAFSLSNYVQVLEHALWVVLSNPLGNGAPSAYFLTATKIPLFTIMFLSFWAYILDIIGHQQFFLAFNSLLMILAVVMYSSVDCTNAQIAADVDCNNESQFGFSIFLCIFTFFGSVVMLLPAFLLLGQRILFGMNIGVACALSNLFYFVIDAPENLTNCIWPLVISAIFVFLLGYLDYNKDQQLSPSQQYNIIDCSRMCSWCWD